MTAFFKADSKHPLATPLPIADPGKRDGLDHGIGLWVNLLREHGVETFESCQGGEGHAYPEPTIAFGDGGRVEDGWHALAVALCYRMPVAELRLTWPIDYAGNHPAAPRWELVFRHSVEATS